MGLGGPPALVRGPHTARFEPFEGILDRYPGAVAAYSFRNLRLAWVGEPVVRVRRSSDNAEANFTAAEMTDGTLLAWVGAGNGFVRTLFDQSGHARDQVQTTSTAQPQIVSSGSLITLSGHPVMQGNGSRWVAFSSGSDVFGSTAYACFTVLGRSLPNTTGNTVISVDAGGATHDFFQEGAGVSLRLTCRRGDTPTSSADLDIGPSLAACNYRVISTSNRVLRVNGSQTAKTDTHSNFTKQNLVLGARRTDGTDAYRGRIAEAIFYAGDKAAEWEGIEANQVEAHL